LSRTRVKRIQKLLPVEEIGIANVLEAKSAELDKRLKEGLPIINCECGTEILVVPDLKAMNRAINTHVAEHRKKEALRTKYSHPGKISQLLSQLTISKMSEQNNN
jgi:hypothetical protein